MQNQKKRDSKLGKNQTQKEPLIDPKYKSLFTTGLVIAVIAIFFFVNNSNSETEQGPYPPGYQGSENAASNPLVNKDAPDFKLTTTENQTLQLNELKGKVVLIDFWATWCPPCRKSIPDLIALKNKYKDKGFEIVGISLDQQNSLQDVVPFVKDYKINYPVVYADMNVWMDYGQVQSIPTSFLVNKEGKIVASYVGYIPENVYESEINKHL